jgi:gas vesicle protein
LIGSILGVLAGIFFAPKSGKELRSELKEKGSEVLKDAKEIYEESRAKAKAILEDTRLRAEELKKEAERHLAEARQKAKEILARGEKVVRKRRPKPVKRRKESQKEEKSKWGRDDHESNASNAIDHQCYRHCGNPGFGPHLLHPCSSPGPSDSP